MVAIGLMMFLKNPKVKLNRLFFGCASSLALWTFGYFLMYMTRDPASGLFYARLGYLGVVFIPTFFLHFVLEFLNFKRERLLIGAYIFSGIFLIISRFNIFISGVYLYFWGFYPKAGPLYLVFVVYFYACCGACVTYLLKAYIELRKTGGSQLKLNQVKYVLLAFFVASLSISDYLPNYHVEVYPFAYLVAFGWLVLMAYGTFKYRVIDINLIIRKTIVYTVVTGTLLVGYFLIVGFFARLSEGLTGYRTIYSSAIAAGLITFFSRSLVKRVQTFVDTKFFRQYVDREEKLYELSRDVVTHNTPEAMGQALQNVLMETFHPKSGMLFLRSKDSSGFIPVTMWGSMTVLHLPEDNALMKYFADHPQPFVQDLPTGSGSPRDTRTIYAQRRPS